MELISGLAEKRKKKVTREANSDRDILIKPGYNSDRDIISNQDILTGSQNLEL